MPGQAYHRQEGPFTAPNSQNFRQSRHATQILQQVLQQDQETAAKRFPWQCPPPSPSKKKPMSAKSAAVLERFHERHAAHHVGPFSLPPWQGQCRPRPAPDYHHMKPALQGLFHTRLSPMSSTTPHSRYSSLITSRPVTQVSTTPVHGRPAHHRYSQRPQCVANDQESQAIVPKLTTERLAASAAKTRIHQILHRDGTRRASDGRGTARATRAGGSGLKRQLSVNNGDAREELARLAESRTGGNNNTISMPSKKARKRAEK
ncbi:hypothetical protein QBC36DRAFT_385487 [Triangularia setosa]|uniref:Uncharacterized protein n=1 Tax=Triangularia setosa TaxID=2587417 RepID=A0AAN6WBY4_9PEZI|nr:hypothetical protein QBC36DRAFT_385487 [Podospora setosa]